MRIGKHVNPIVIVALLVAGCTPKPASEKLASDTPATLHHASFLSMHGEDWKLIWHDEFTGKSLDTSKWKIGLPWKGTDGEGHTTTTSTPATSWTTTSSWKTAC